MTDREKLAQEIEGLNDLGLRRQCVDILINARLGGHNIEETIRRADILYRYITNGEIPTDGEELAAPLPPIPRDIPITPTPIPNKPVCG